MPVEEFRAAAHQVVDLIADYLAGVETLRRLPAGRTRVAAAALPGVAAGGTRADSRRSSPTTAG